MYKNWIDKSGISRGHRAGLAFLALIWLIVLWPASAAQAACTSPQTATITSGGTATFTCADFDFIPPVDVPPSHGSLTFERPPNTSALMYTNNGDGATSDMFIVQDDSATPITFNITINPSPSPLTVTPAALPAPVVGTSYNQMLSTTGGSAPYSYALVAGSILPPGLTLSSSGVISGTATGSGDYTFTVRVMDSTTPIAITVDKSYTVKILAPIINITPDTPPDGGVGTAYSVQFSASGGTPGYTYTSLSGSLPAGLSLSGSGLLSGTPSAVGSSTFKLKVQDSTTMFPSGVHFLLQDVTVTINAFPPVSLTPASGTALSAGVVGTSYSNASISASGGAGTISYAVTSGSLPAGLNFNTSTGAITGTPTAGALGTTTFTVTATAATGGSMTAVYSITITTQPLTMTPASGALASGTGGITYSTTISATGGVGAITFAVTAGALPPGLTLNTVTGEISGAATATGTFNISITATAATSGSAVNSYSITMIAPPLNLTPATGSALTSGVVGSAYSDTLVSASAPMGAVTFFASGLPDGLIMNTTTGAITGTPTASALGTTTIVVNAESALFGNVEQATYTITIAPSPVVLTPTTGTALSAGTVGVAYSDSLISASGGVGTIGYAVTSGALPDGLTLNATTGRITGMPTAAAFGTATFTVTATAATSGSAAASYTITVGGTVVGLTPAPGTALSAGTVGVSYSDTSISASGGVGAISYAVTTGTLPAGVSLNAATAAITGTPTASGDFSFTVTATDTVGTSGSAGYSLKIEPPKVTFVFTPPGGALDEAMAGEEYSQSITANGGTGPLIYSVVSGELPKGLALNISTGELTGPLSVDAGGTHSFTIQVRDGTGATGKATFTLSVKRRAATVADVIVEVPAGETPANVYLNRGATGGPFTGAELAFVEPANAGTATIIRGGVAAVDAAGWYLQFKPDPAYSGEVRVGYRLISALGASNTGVITYRLALDADRVAEEIDALVSGFVETRQNMISSAIKVPGLLERRQMEAATDPITARMMPSEEGMTGSVSTSLRQMEAARDNADGVSAAASSPFNIWVDGTFLVHNRDDNEGRWGSFAMINTGADYLLTEKVLVGLSVHYDRMSDPSDADAELTGNGWLAGPYASFEIARNIFWNTSLRYGGSSNEIETAFWDGTFDTARWMADTSLEGQWNIDDATTFTPKLRILYFSERVDDYTVRNNAGETVDIGGYDQEQFRASLGAEIARSFTLEDGTQMTPKLGVTGGYSGLDGSGAFGSLTAGVSSQTAQLWMLDLSLLLNVADGGATSTGGRIRAAKQF